MTFQEGHNLIVNMSANPYNFNNELFTAIVVPENLNERIRFLEDLKKGKININDSVQYSLDGNFVVCGFMNKAFNI